MKVEDITEEALALPSEARALLADRLVYTIGEGVIHIIAVMHCSREPGY
jgi:hypothetical protein